MRVSRSPGAVSWSELTVDFSVVIPTYNRCQVLVRTLQALLAQKDDSCPSSYEIVVVDDGSTDETERQVRDLESAASGQIVYLHQPNRKQGAARNLGAGKAQGDFLVFLGDDTIPDPGFLSQHSAGRRKRGQWSRDSRLVVIGRTRWARHLATTRFTRYIGEQGWQFGFSLIADPENVPFNFFYTSNLSIGRRFFLDSGGFDEDFQEYGWEDIELSLRLCKNGMRLVYQPDAVA